MYVEEDETPSPHTNIPNGCETKEDRGESIDKRLPAKLPDGAMKVSSIVPSTQPVYIDGSLFLCLIRCSVTCSSWIVRLTLFSLVKIVATRVI